MEGDKGVVGQRPGRLVPHLRFMPQLRGTLAVEGGPEKRLDEHRELVELLLRECPELFEEKPWVLGWLESQDTFLRAIHEFAGLFRLPFGRKVVRSIRSTPDYRYGRASPGP